MSLALRADLTPAVLEEMAVDAGACIRPVLSRVTDRATGEMVEVALACGATRESKCPPCAVKARRLRMQQCREGWHLTEEPAAEGEKRREADETDLPSPEQRRTRSTRRRNDTPDLPKIPMDPTTIGRTFTSASGRTYRPSMFITLTLPSYGRVTSEGVPVSPATYDYRRAALDALHFPKLVDRFWQNLRRCAGYRVQYFSVIEEQRRLAPHLHAGVRGAIPRQLLKQVAAATYHQVWWPEHDEPLYAADKLPYWEPLVSGYVDRAGTILPTWEEALDELDCCADLRPAHVLRFGSRIDIQGITAETDDADRRVAYLCKYLTKSLTGSVDEGDSAAWQRHVERLHQEIRWLPCSPECSNWLQFGVQPRDAVEGMVPGQCPKPAHDRENLGLGGRRVLVSRQWTGKTLGEHRADRHAVVRAVLEEAGLDTTDTSRLAADVLASDGSPRYRWERIAAVDQDPISRKRALLASIRERVAWRSDYERAKNIRDPVSHIGPSADFPQVTDPNSSKGNGSC